MPDFDDLSDPATLDNALASGATYGTLDRQHALFTYLRREDPVHWTTPAGFRPFWAVTKHADIIEVEKQQELFINAPRAKMFSIEFEEKVRAAKHGKADVVRSLPQMDNPDHRAYRQLTQAWFQAKQVRLLEERIAALAKRSLDELEQMGPELDFYRDIAVWFPLRVIMLILGLPADDEKRLQKITQAYFGGADPEMQGGSDLIKAAQDFVDYFDGVSEARRAQPTDDVASVIANGTIDGKPLEHIEASSYYIALASAGHDTTSASAAGGVLALIENPAEWAKLKADPTLTPAAVEEIIRWVSPVKHFFRTAAADYTLRGKQIKAGDNLLMCYPSANRDEDVFADPFSFRVDRNPNRHLGFGYGAHACIGLFLAKTELQIFFRELLARVERFELTGQPAWIQTAFVGGLKRLPVRVEMVRQALMA
ncbi:MAG: cytochrome P450 [Janthinobacterium lividum]